MKVLIVGAGVVGTVYGAHLAAAGKRGLGAQPRTEDR
jgi:ketopantoate reductase